MEAECLWGMYSWVHVICRPFLFLSFSILFFFLILLDYWSILTYCVSVCALVFYLSQLVSSPKQINPQVKKNHITHIQTYFYEKSIYSMEILMVWRRSMGNDIFHGEPTTFAKSNWESLWDSHYKGTVNLGLVWIWFFKKNFLKVKRKKCMYWHGEPLSLIPLLILYLLNIGKWIKLYNIS